MRLDLNLATRFYLDKKQVNGVFTIVFTILLVVLASSVALISTSAGKIQKTKGEIASLDRRISGTAAVVSDKELKEVLDQVKTVNGIIDRKVLNWNGLLNRLELIVPEGVAVTALEPEVSTGKLKMSFVAKNFPLLRKTLEGLEESKFFTDVFLNSQSEVSFSETQKGLAFSVICGLDYRKL